MKNLFFGRVLLTVIVFSLCSFSLREAHYYVVIGAFAKESNARKFTGFARNLYLDAHYTFNSERNLYYVQVMETSRKEEAKNWSLYLKYEKGFDDAWVFTSRPVDQQSFAAEEASAYRSSPRYSGNTDVPLSNYSYIASASGSDNIARYQNAEKSTYVAANMRWTETDDVSYIKSPHNIVRAIAKMGMAEDKVFRFVAETTGGKTIPAEIMLVDYKKARKITEFKTGDYVGLKGKKKGQSVTLVCDVFGYSVETKVVKLNDPSRAQGITNNDGVWEVKFKLKPMKENDISILYNTTFYKDAAVLQPSSKAQLEQVLALMKEHPSYEILIHSHCNKGARRDLKIRGDDNAYFDLDAAVEKTGSDKQLTKARAEVIRDFLVDNGIDRKRIGVFGWGSLDNLVSPASANTAINDRIEVELAHN